MRGVGTVERRVAPERRNGALAHRAALKIDETLIALDPGNETIQTCTWPVSA
jgi:hypothetical protein